MAIIHVYTVDQWESTKCLQVLNTLAMPLETLKCLRFAHR